MAALATMRLQTISYHGRPVACATATRFFLTDALEQLPAGDPLLTFVLYMCAYAREVHTGELPGPYTDHDARRFARAALVPEEFADPDRIAHTQADGSRAQAPRRRARRCARRRRSRSGSEAAASVHAPATRSMKDRVTDVLACRSLGVVRR